MSDYQREKDGIPDGDDTYVDDGGHRCVRPSIEQLERWSNEGYCYTEDGCKVEEDGQCEHGYDSWMLVLGLI